MNFLISQMKKDHKGEEEDWKEEEAVTSVR